ERALAVGDEAVHRDAHRVDQHGITLNLGHRSFCSLLRHYLVTDRETKTDRLGRYSDRTATAWGAQIAEIRSSSVIEYVRSYVIAYGAWRPRRPTGRPRPLTPAAPSASGFAACAREWTSRCGTWPSGAG